MGGYFIFFILYFSVLSPCPAKLKGNFYSVSVPLGNVSAHLFNAGSHLFNVGGCTEVVSPYFGNVTVFFSSVDDYPESVNPHFWNDRAHLFNACGFLVTVSNYYYEVGSYLLGAAICLGNVTNGYAGQAVVLFLKINLTLI